MKFNEYLIINSRGIIRLRRTKQDLRLDEISINLKMEIPDSLFPVPKTFVAPVTITDDTKQEQSIEIKIS